jgi:peptidoglycan/LPS O-acetylase OafA/YrhL
MSSLITQNPLQAPLGKMREAHADQDAHRVRALDGIRGIAISSVFLFHAAPFIQDRVGPFYPIFLQGWAGVDLFFVLSGFLITSVLLRTKYAAGYFRNFYARRVLRIFPIYYIFLAVVALMFMSFPSQRPRFADVYGAQGWYWAYLENWVLAFRAQFNPSFLGHFWSLAIEEQFYIFWPFVVWVFKEKHLLVICGCIVIGSLVLRVALVLLDPSLQKFIYFSTLTRMDSLAMGAMTAVILRDGLPDRDLRVYSAYLLLLPLAGLALIAALNPSIWDNLWMNAVGLTLTGAASTGVLLRGLRNDSKGTARILKSSFLVAVGRYSYALYVVHWPVIEFTNSALRKATVTGVTYSILFIVVSVGASWGLAFFSWHLVEKRCLAQKRRFSERSARVDERLRTFA